MTQTYSLFRSRTFWMLVVMSLLPVANAIVPVLPAAGQNIAEVVLAMIAAYFHNDTAQKFGAHN